MTRIAQLSKSMQNALQVWTIHSFGKVEFLNVR